MPHYALSGHNGFAQTVFNFYINDLPASISDAHGEVGFEEMSISWLLYADGLIMLAEMK